jgi:telomerase protein component 1
MESMDIVSIPIKDPLERLVNSIATCLIREPSYYQSEDERVSKLLICCDNVAQVDPEFILQLAYYTRSELNLRSSTNFLLAYAAANKKPSKDLFKKYAPHCIRLPTDLLEVVEMVQILLKNTTTTKLKIPSALKAVCQEKFVDFSDYQLGKHCSEGLRKRELEKAKKKKVAGTEEKVPVFEMNMNMAKKIADKARRKIAMKSLIRTCHISEPKYEVMCILGKRCPDKEEFMKLFPKKTFTEGITGKRMRIPVPITWETELSAKGNNAAVWTDLVQKNQLPYMAMLRNLRNILTAGVSAEVHKKICERIQDFNQVTNSKLFPYRFFSAYHSINSGALLSEEPIMRRLKPGRIKKNKKAKNKKAKAPKEMPSTETIGAYQAALNTAIKISIANNIKPIPGKTVVFADTSGSMSCPVSGAGTVGESAVSCMDVGILMGLMLKHACAESEYFIFSSPREKECFLQINEFDKDDMLKNITKIKEMAENLGGGTDFPFAFWEDAIKNKKHVDMFVMFSDMMIAGGYSDIGGQKYSAMEIINLYRSKVNPNMVYICVDLNSYNVKLPFEEQKDNPLNILIFGYSDSILRFISERQVHQVKYIKELASKLSK